MKTKNQELDILRDAIAKLGPDSYLGPWLSSVIHSVESDIRSDMYPLITIPVARQQCQDEAKRIIEDAQIKAGSMIDKAKREAQAIEDTARAFRASADTYKFRVLHAIRNATEAVERV